MASVRGLFVFFAGVVGAQAVLAAEPTLAANGDGTVRDVILLEVDKTNLRADLRTWPENFEKSNLLMSFRIAIGKQEGDKQVEGDNKTPEGIYFSQDLIDGSTLPAKYGPKAIPINFPNPHDLMMSKTGHGIWLHGVEQDQRVEQAKVTEGCVAFYNADILTLARWLKPYQAMVMISRDGSQSNKPEDLRNVRERTLEWIDAWKDRQLDQFLSFYSPDKFQFQKMNLKAYGEYKDRVFKSYKNMELKADNLRVLAHSKYAMAIFNQDFNGDNRYVSQGRKVLYWTKNDKGEWQIFREMFENRRIELVSFTAAEIAKFTENSPSFKLLKPGSHTPNL